jgi:hypothetical protein
LGFSIPKFDDRIYQRGGGSILAAGHLNDQGQGFNGMYPRPGL